MTQEHIHCLILGSGPAGYTAAIYAARAGIKPVVYQGPQVGGQLTITNDVENYPGYPEGVNGPQMMVDFQKQAERFGTDIRNGLATSVDFSNSDALKVIIDDTHEITADAIIIATGASAKWLGLEGERKFMYAGVSACAVCDGYFYRGKDVIVVGAGDTACEEATYLSKLCKKVYMIVRKDEMRASKIMQKRVLNTPNIEILWNSETQEITGIDAVAGAIIKNNKTGELRELQVDGFFVAIGHKPNTDIFEKQIVLDEAGYILTLPGTTKTSVEGVFAAGDVQDTIYRQAVTAAGTGCMAALDLERYLAAKEVTVV